MASEIEPAGRATPLPFPDIVEKVLLDLVPHGTTVAFVAEQISAQWHARRCALAEQILDGVDPEAFLDRLRSDERFVDLFVYAVERVATVPWEANRQAMGRIVRSAFDDRDTDVDESEGLLRSYTDLTAPDFRALEVLKEVTEMSSKEAVPPSGVTGLETALPALVRNGAVKMVAGYDETLYGPSPLGLRLLIFVTL